MLIKCTIDDTVSFLSSSNIQGNALVMWILQEHLPLDAPVQLEGLAKAIGLDDPRKIDIKQLTFIVNDEQLDWSKNPVENRLMGGSIGTITSRSVTPRTARQVRSGLSEADFESSFADLRMARGMSRASGVFRGDEDGGDDAGSAGGNAVDEDEVYVGEECGWFPFKVENNYGQLPIGSFMDPTKPVAETDGHPHIQHLCADCSHKMAQAEPLDVNVDRHYKPMAVRTEVCDGWVEKLSLNLIARWQKRFLSISEKSLDWFTEEPTAGLKTKIRGTRKVVTDASCNIGEVIETPDPVKYPKCKDVNFFHFGVTFIEPAQTVFFRVTSIQDRNRYVLFLKSAKERAASGANGSRRNPVYWKKWADAFLTNLTDLGEAAVSNDKEADELARRLQEIAEKKAELLEEQPGLEAVINEKKEVVRRLATEIERVKVAKMTMEREAVAAEDKIEEEKLSLIELEVGLGDEVRSAEMLRSHAGRERDDSDLRVQTLLEEIEMLKERHRQTFLRWRKHEEANAAAIAFGKSTSATQRNKSVAGSKALSFSVDGIGLAAGVRTLPVELQEASVRSRAAYMESMMTAMGDNAATSIPGSINLEGSTWRSFSKGSGAAAANGGNSPFRTGGAATSLMSPDAKDPVGRALSQNGGGPSRSPSHIGWQPHAPSRESISVPLGSPIYKNRGGQRSRRDLFAAPSFSDVSKSSPLGSPGSNAGAKNHYHDIGATWQHVVGDDDDDEDEDIKQAMANIERVRQFGSPAAKTARANNNIDAIQGLIHHQASIQRSLGLIQEKVSRVVKKKPVPSNKEVEPAAVLVNAATEKEEAAAEASKPEEAAVVATEEGDKVVVKDKGDKPVAAPAEEKGEATEVKAAAESRPDHDNASANPLEAEPQPKTARTPVATQ